MDYSIRPLSVSSKKAVVWHMARREAETSHSTLLKISSEVVVRMHVLLSSNVKITHRIIGLSSILVTQSK